MNTDTTRQFAVVTGASSGIGLELAKQFAKNGFDLLIAAGSNSIHTAVRTDPGSRWSSSAGTDGSSELRRCGETLLGHSSGWPPLDAAAINAGVGVSGEFTDTDLDAELNLDQAERSVDSPPG